MARPSFSAMGWVELTLLVGDVGVVVRKVDMGGAGFDTVLEKDEGVTDSKSPE